MMQAEIGGTFMLGRMYDDQNCSVARALEVVGERWSLLIIRDAIFGGVTKFTDFQRNLGIAPNILATRLDVFVTEGLMQTRQYSDQHREYVLTDKGLGLQPTIIALTEWGDRWAAPDGPPIAYQHDDCGGHVDLTAHCAACGKSLTPAQIIAQPGNRTRYSP